MSEKPILFNTYMVRAILDGRKTQTRRVVVPHYRDGDAGFNVITNAATGKFLYIEYYDEYESSTERRLNPPYIPGDVLWVRETWNYGRWETEGIDPYCHTWFEEETPGAEWQNSFFNRYVYRADASLFEHAPEPDCWHPSIHMPKEAARIFLKVSNVRAERLCSITEKDAMAEGVSPEPPFSFPDTYRRGFQKLWDSLADESTNWNANPWVWVYEFERIKP